MKNRIKQVIAGLAFSASFIVLSALAPSGPTYDLTWHTIDGGGGTSIGGTFELSGTAGQPDPVVSTGSGYELTGGFWSAFEQLPCPSDSDGNGVIDVEDLLDLLAAWGPCPGCPEDSDGNGVVDVEDLLDVLAGWGLCP